MLLRNFFACASFTTPLPARPSAEPPSPRFAGRGERKHKPTPVSPPWRHRRAVEDLSEPRAGAARCLGRQRIEREEPIVDDLVRMLRSALLAKGAQHEHHDMVTARDAPVEEYTVQHRRLESR